MNPDQGNCTACDAKMENTVTIWVSFSVSRPEWQGSKKACSRSTPCTQALLASDFLKGKTGAVYVRSFSQSLSVRLLHSRWSGSGQKTSKLCGLTTQHQLLLLTPLLMTPLISTINECRNKYRRAISECPSGVQFYACLLMGHIAALGGEMVFWRK